MRLTLDRDFSIDRVEADIDLQQQSDKTVRTAFDEALRVGMERGLWAPGGLDPLAQQVASELGSLSLREQLLSTAEQGAKLYTEVVSEGINQARNEEGRIPLLRPEEYRERAEQWLTPGRVAAAAMLSASSRDPRLLIPRLNRPITLWENTEAWRVAGNGKVSITDRTEELLGNWTADELSGFDPESDEETPFEILQTAYDFSTSGTRDEQKAVLETLQRDHPELSVASIFSGALLSKRLFSWHSSVRAIDLQPVFDDGRYSIPSAGINEPDDGPSSAGIGVYGGDQKAPVRYSVQ
jgi:hypothetical protein